YQGQKCSAASRAYIPRSLWSDVRDRCVAMMNEIKQGDVRDFRNFVAAVIDERAFDRNNSYLELAKTSANIIAGGTGDKSKGWYIKPTLIEATDPSHRLLCEEIFGPILTCHVYDDAKWEDTLRLVDATSPYALTGAVFARERQALRTANAILRQAAGNFY